MNLLLLSSKFRMDRAGIYPEHLDAIPDLSKGDVPGSHSEVNFHRDISRKKGTMQLSFSPWVLEISGMPVQISKSSQAAMLLR